MKPSLTICAFTINTDNIILQHTYLGIGISAILQNNFMLFTYFLSVAPVSHRVPQITFSVDVGDVGCVGSRAWEA